MEKKSKLEWIWISETALVSEQLIYFSIFQYQYQPMAKFLDGVGTSDLKRLQKNHYLCKTLGYLMSIFMTGDEIVAVQNLSKSCNVEKK